jgi:hypothetical protein
MLAYLDRSGCSIFYPKGIVSGLKVWYTSITCRGARPSCIFGCRPFSRGRELTFKNQQGPSHCTATVSVCPYVRFKSSTIYFHGPFEFSPHLHFLLLDIICDIRTFYMSSPCFSTASSRTTVRPFPLTVIWPTQHRPIQNSDMDVPIMSGLEHMGPLRFNSEPEVLVVGAHILTDGGPHSKRPLESVAKAKGHDQGSK